MSTTALAVADVAVSVDTVPVDEASAAEDIPGAAYKSVVNHAIANPAASAATDSADRTLKTTQL